MSLRPRMVTPPAELPVSIDEARAHLRIYHEEDDALIEGFIGAAVAYIDGPSGILGRCIVSQTWRQDFTGWPGDRQLRMPLPDVDPDSVAILYRDAADEEQTLAGSMSEVIEEATGSVVVLRRGFNAPSLASDRRAPVAVTFDAGYGPAEKVPASIKHAILLIVGDLYENRENTVVGEVQVNELPLGAHTLLAPLRRLGS